MKAKSAIKDEIKTAKNATILFCCVEYGSAEKVYFRRQIGSFKTINPIVLCWRNFSTDRNIKILSLNRPWQTKFGRRLNKLIRIFNENYGFESCGSELKDIKSLIKSVQPDAIYAHTGFMGVKLLPLKNLLGVPLVVHFHGLDINLPDRAYQSALARALPYFDKIIVCAEWMRPYFHNRGIEDDMIATIPMGAPASDINISEISFEKKRSNEVVEFVFVGRLVPYKAINVVIAAVGRLVEQRYNVLYTIVGDGPELARLKALVEARGLSQYVRFTGSVSSSEALAIMGRGDVFIHCPTDANGGPEAFGVAITEAMASGKPVIASRCGGIPDQVEHERTGLLVPQEDETATFEAMRRLADDASLRAEFGQRGRERALNEFDSATLAGRVEDELIRIVAKANRVD